MVTAACPLSLAVRRVNGVSKRVACVSSSRSRHSPHHVGTPRRHHDPSTGRRTEYQRRVLSWAGTGGIARVSAIVALVLVPRTRQVTTHHEAVRIATLGSLGVAHGATRGAAEDEAKGVEASAADTGDASDGPRTEGETPAGFASGDYVAEEDLSSLLARLMNEYGENSGAPAAAKSEGTPTPNNGASRVSVLVPPHALPCAAVDSFKEIVVESEDSLPKEVGVRLDGRPGEVRDSRVAACTQTGLTRNTLLQIAAVPAAFGPEVALEGITAPLVVADPILGDSDFVNAGDMKGAIVVVQRGKVGFAVKARRAQAAGALAVIVGQTANVWPYTMTDSKTNGVGVDIPVVMLRKEHAALSVIAWVQLARLAGR